MYSKQRSTKTSKQFNDVNVGNDKGSLRLQFSTRISEKFYSKRQAYKGLGRSDTPDNRNWAEGIARRIQEDIDYQNGANFDPTLVKYLDIKPVLATVTQLPNAKPLPTLGELWNEFVEWKRKTKQIEETTYQHGYKSVYQRMIKNYLDNPLNEETANDLINHLLSKTANKAAVKRLLGILSQMCQRAILKKIPTEDYFSEVKETYTVPKKSNQQQEQEDLRAYTIEERDLIINTFRNHEKTSIRHHADLIEFLFLTGCRHGEAFALQWKCIKFDTGWIYFKHSYDGRTKITKSTKTNTSRMFKMKGMARLIDLLKRMYGDGKNDDELIFKTETDRQYNNYKLQNIWNKHAGGAIKGKKYQYIGVVKELVNENKLQYLKPYSTRHTFISIQANNGADLGILADSCGNSVDVLMKHYLQPDKEKTLKDV